MKGILITEATRPALASRYQLEDYEKEERLPLGYILVADFGNDYSFELLSSTVFDASFVKGAALQNDWFDMEYNPPA